MKNCTLHFYFYVFLFITFEITNFDNRSGAYVHGLLPDFRYLRDHPSVFLKFCMKLGYHKVTKVTQDDF